MTALLIVTAAFYLVVAVLLDRATSREFVSQHGATIDQPPPPVRIILGIIWPISLLVGLVLMRLKQLK